jgi:hypothetical protein
MVSNGIKLIRIFIIPQRLTKLSTGRLHERILLRPPFAHSWCIAIRTMGLDHQRDEDIVVSCAREKRNQDRNRIMNMRR